MNSKSSFDILFELNLNSQDGAILQFTCTLLTNQLILYEYTMAIAQLIQYYSKRL